MASPFLCISLMTSSTTLRMPFKADSCVFASQLRLGNSAQSPTYSLSSSDQVTRYVNLSFFADMIHLQPFYCQEHLFNLICFCFPFMILNIYPWIALPRGFVNPVTAPPLARFAKIMIAYFA